MCVPDAAAAPRWKRVAIVGPCGSGKSTLAEQLGRLLRLEVIHLDQVLFLGVPMPKEEKAAKVADLVRGRRWIIEGDHPATQPLRFAAADMIVFLDVPAHVCLWRAVGRRIRRRRKRATGSGDRRLRMGWRALKCIALYPLRTRRKVIAQIEAYSDEREAVALRGSEEVDAFLHRVRAALAAETPAPPDDRP